MKPYFWLGAEADFDQVVIDTLDTPVPLIVIDTTDIDE